MISGKCDAIIYVCPTFGFFIRIRQELLLEEVDILANVKSAKKRIKVGATKRIQNQMIKSAMKTAVKKVKIAVEAGDYELASNLFSDAASQIDKAAKAGVIHKNTAANKKSGLARQINGLAS